MGAGHRVRCEAFGRDPAPCDWSDVDERRRSSDPRLRQAIKGSTSWWVTVRHGKRGRIRAIALEDDALEAIVAWVNSRPVA